LKHKPRLSKSMTLTEFTNGYWYATEIKEFADSIGIRSAGKLRKDELEKAIIHFLTTGKIQTPTKRSLSQTGTKDVEKGLSLKLPIVNYTNDKETKDFIEKESRKIEPTFKRRSGARYRLNRWREEQITNGNQITYGDLVNQYIKLNQTDEPYTRIPIACYVYFLSDYLKAEKNANRKDAIKAWHKLKKLDIPKDYQSWRRFRDSQ
jgi:hypothetical protein